jgi:hypothetical protein
MRLRALFLRLSASGFALLLLESAGAQVAAPAIARLSPSAPPVEVVDPEERISGNATTGLVLVHREDAIGHDRLWAYLSPPVANKLELTLSSVDGRYYAEVEYAPPSATVGWVALDLSLREFAFLEDNYNDPLSEIAALLADADGPRFYPVRWAGRHAAASGRAPSPPTADDRLRLYMNTERASAFVVVDDDPAPCRSASTVSSFKFNAICELKLGDITSGSSEGGAHIANAIQVFRRAGVRSLEPVTLDLQIRY